MADRSPHPWLPALEAAYWHLAHNWQAHLFHAPRHAFDFEAFAPEAREMMDSPEQRLFDALKRAAAINPWAKP